MEKPIISVIIPCYNAEKTIVSTLESLEKQSFKNFEVIIVNDGSIDRSHYLIEERLKLNILNVKYILQENFGVSVARNSALEQVTGEYIVFLDADDVYHKDFLRFLYTYISNNNVDTVVCKYSRNIDSIVNSVNNNICNIEKLNHLELLNFFMHRKGPTSFFTFIYKKKIICDFNIWFNPTLKYGEDLEFTWKYLIHSKHGLFIDKALYGYSDNPSSAMNNISWRVTDVLISVKNIEKYLYNTKDEFYVSYKKYMFARTLWAILKDFSYYGKKTLFVELCNEYDTKIYINNLIKLSNNLKIKISSKIFCTSRQLFYDLFKLSGKFNIRKNG